MANRDAEMGHFDDIEPLPHVIAGLGRLNPDQGMRVIALLRLRRDQGDGIADAAWRNWRRAIAPVLESVGAVAEVMSDASLVVVGDPELWDRVTITSYPNSRAFLKFLSDERTLDQVSNWRAALENVHMFVIGDPVTV
jgi:hypothetical protein